MATPQLPERLPLIGLDGILLRHGSHSNRTAEGVCAMEAVSWIAGEPHSDAPSCACPIIRSFVIALNDGIKDDAVRTALLKPLVPHIVGTKATKEIEQQRGLMAADWLIRVHTPPWLDLRPSLVEHATALRGLPPLTTWDAVQATQPVLSAAHSAAATDSAAARDAARAAAGAAAWDAAWAAARDAAGAAARDAARDAARAAAGAAAWDAAWAAAWAAAWDAAWDAAGAAAWDAARAAARDAAYPVAHQAAFAIFQPVVEQLQQSASDLLIRMIDAGKELLTP